MGKSSCNEEGHSLADAAVISVVASGCCKHLNKNEDADVHGETFIPDEAVDDHETLSADEEGDVEVQVATCVLAVQE